MKSTATTTYTAISTSSLSAIKRYVYEVLGTSTTKGVKKLFPEYDLRQRASWLAVLKVVYCPPALFEFYDDEINERYVATHSPRATLSASLFNAARGDANNIVPFTRAA